MQKVWLLVLPLFMVGCTPVLVDYDRSVDFRGLKTYAWVSTLQEGVWEKALREDIMVRRVVELTDRDLAQRGFAKVREGKPDFLISFTPMLRSRLAVGGSPSQAGGAYDFRATPDAGIRLDIWDPATRNVVWTGMGGRGLDGSLTSMEGESLISDTLHRLLKAFPPRPLR